MSITLRLGLLLGAIVIFAIVCYEVHGKRIRDPGGVGGGVEVGCWLTGAVPPGRACCEPSRRAGR